MGDRVKIFGVVALLGFLAGVIAQLTADFIIPWLWTVLPALINLKWVVSGVAGATITVVLISVWAYFSGSREHP
jgi:chromate transport protein ChrA